MNKKNILVVFVIAFLSSGYVYYFGLQWLNSQLGKAYNNGAKDGISQVIQAAQEKSVSMEFIKDAKCKDTEDKKCERITLTVEGKKPQNNNPTVEERTEPEQK